MQNNNYWEKPYEKVLIQQEDGTYYAKIREFAGCSTSGKTPQEALSNLEEIMKELLQSEIEQKHIIPEPDQDQNYSGTFLIRTSPALHQECAENAQRQGVSFNKYVIQLLASRTREDSLVDRFREYLNAPIRVIFQHIVQTGPVVNERGSFIVASARGDR